MCILVFPRQAQHFFNDMFSQNLRGSNISKNVSFIKEEKKLSEAIELILSGFRRIPVVGEGNYVKGIISNIDILNYLGGGEKHQLFLKRKKWQRRILFWIKI